MRLDAAVSIHCEAMTVDLDRMTLDEDVTLHQHKVNVKCLRIPCQRGRKISRGDGRQTAYPLSYARLPPDESTHNCNRPDLRSPSSVGIAIEFAMIASGIFTRPGLPAVSRALSRSLASLENHRYRSTTRACSYENMPAMTRPTSVFSWMVGFSGTNDQGRSHPQGTVLSTRSSMNAARRF